MKRIIYSSVVDPDESTDRNYMTYTRSGQRFGVHLYSDDPNHPSFQVSEIHPYDDADYAWARCGYVGPQQVEFIRRGKVFDRMQWPTYDEDSYEDSTEYLNDLLDETCVRLLRYNEAVEPRIIHY